MTRITKREYERMGGIANPKLSRRERNGRWQYFRL